LVELESAAYKLPTITPHLALNRGYALMQTKRYEQVLVDFEFAINIKPNYAIALDYAAHCAFMIGDQVKGIKYAKEARKYGEPRTYNDWRKGSYKKLGTKYPE
jgi:tetratricopeptide (TPR) repeat protein